MKNLIYLLLVAVTLSACENEEAQTSIEGTWEQVTPPAVFSGSKYKQLTLKTAEFSIVGIEFNDTPIGPCNKIVWDIWVKGNYQLKNDTLVMDGLYTDAAFNVNHNQECLREGAFKMRFLYKLKGDSLFLGYPGESGYYKFVRK